MRAMTTPPRAISTSSPSIWRMMRENGAFATSSPSIWRMMLENCAFAPWC
jgi:hypothetical protein